MSLRSAFSQITWKQGVRGSVEMGPGAAPGRAYGVSVRERTHALTKQPQLKQYTYCYLLYVLRLLQLFLVLPLLLQLLLLLL